MTALHYTLLMIDVFWMIANFYHVSWELAVLSVWLSVIKFLPNGANNH